VIQDSRKTEQADTRYEDIATLSAFDSLTLQLQSQIEAVEAIKPALHFIARAAEAATFALSHEEGRLIYTGAGTSGRLGIQDGVELTPTFGWAVKRRIYLMAGGNQAVFRSVEGAEDDWYKGFSKMGLLRPKEHDVVIGVAASGTTPFTIGALDRARKLGAVTIAIANNPGTPLLDTAEFPICVETGAEVISGSTRLKAGTTQKIVLNMLSNQIMIGLGKVYRGRMVDMQATNEKLKKRAVRMVRELTDCDEEKAVQMLGETKGWIKPTILMAKFNLSATGAEEILTRHEGHLHRCIDALTPANNL